MSFKNTLTLQDPFSQDSHTSFLLQDLSHMSFKKHTHTARSFLTRTHTHFYCKIFLTCLLKTHSHCKILSHKTHTHHFYCKIFLTCLLKNTLTLQDPFSQDSHTSFLLQDLSHKTAFLMQTHTFQLQDPFSQDCLTHIPSTRFFSQDNHTHSLKLQDLFSHDSILKVHSHIPDAMSFLTRQSCISKCCNIIFLTRRAHTHHFHCKIIFLTRQSFLSITQDLSHKICLAHSLRSLHSQLSS